MQMDPFVPLPASGLGLRVIGLVVVLVAVSACDSGGEPAGESSASAGSEPAPETAASSAQSSPEPEVLPPAPAWEDEGFTRVFGLVDNRHLLHDYDTGLFIDVGHPSANKYIEGNWRAAHWSDGIREGETTWSWTDGVRSLLRFPIHNPSGDYELVARMKASSDTQRMDLFLNDEQVGRTLSDLSTEWREIRFTLPVGLINDGENRLRFHFARSETVQGQGRTAGAFEYVRIQPVGTEPAPAHVSGAFSLSETEDGTPSLSVPAYGRHELFVTVPEGARLRVRVDAEVADIPFSVQVASDDQEGAELWAAATGAEPVAQELDLSPWAGQAVRLTLSGDAPVGDERLGWIDPVLVVPTGAQRTIDPSTRPEHVIVWLVDTLRPDHFPVYNPDTRVEAPNFVAFSEDCVSFRRASVQGNSSLPSSASIHSCTYPPVHQLNSGSARIPRDLTLIAEPFDAVGWSTALYSSNGYVDERRRFVRGYDTYSNLIHEPGRADSEYLVPRLLEWLGEHTDPSTFLYVNTIDPHVPYDPPAEVLQRYFPEPYRGRIRPRGTGELLDQMGDDTLEGTDLRYLTALYDGEITYNDTYFGELITDLENASRRDDTLVVITSDHGEGLFEHGRGGHGAGVYEEVIHVPLMLCHPGSLGSERWVETEVETVDLLPTLTDLFGLETPESVQGISLLPLVLSDTAAMNRPGFSYHQDDIRGLRMGRWKYIHRGGDQDALYDLTVSHIEGDNVRENAPIAYRHARDVMAFHLAFEDVWYKREWGFANNHTAALSATLDGSVW